MASHHLDATAARLPALVATVSADRRGTVLGQPPARRSRSVGGKSLRGVGCRNGAQGIRLYPAVRRGSVAPDRARGGLQRRDVPRRAWPMVRLLQTVRGDLEPAGVRVDTGPVGVLLPRAARDHGRRPPDPRPARPTGRWLAGRAGGLAVEPVPLLDDGPAGDVAAVGGAPLDSPPPTASGRDHSRG